MATLHEYFTLDQGPAFGFGAKLLTLEHTGDPSKKVDVEVRLNFQPESNSFYVSVYIPFTSDWVCPARAVLNGTSAMLDFRKEVEIVVPVSLYDESKFSEAVFTGRIFLYSENDISAEDRTYIKQRSLELGRTVAIRDRHWANDRAAGEKPLAFISHDSRDKVGIAEPLAIELAKMGIPVWFDKFSLTVGQSLRESIESGLRDCPHCVFVITPNFLANGGWPKVEYGSIFTRELVERSNAILPVWHNVSRSDVYAYSPILADRFAAICEGDVSAVARALFQAIKAPKA